MSVDTPILNQGGADADLIKNTTTKDFMRDVVEASREVPVLVDFWAPWCGPCRMIGPVIEQLAGERKDIRFAKLNVDENPRTSQDFGVHGIPLLVFFKDGVERGRVVGAVPKGQIEAAIRQYLG
jgi:putative thioredoxin